MKKLLYPIISLSLLFVIGCGEAENGEDGANGLNTAIAISICFQNIARNTITMHIFNQFMPIIYIIIWELSMFCIILRLLFFIFYGKFYVKC